MKDLEFVVNDNYKHDAARETLIQGINIGGYDDIPNYHKDIIFSAERVKESAIKVNEYIQKLMEIYFR